jgi:hypothetical protein
MSMTRPLILSAPLRHDGVAYVKPHRDRHAAVGMTAAFAGTGARGLW